MEVYVGGYAQGKLSYVKKLHEGECLKIAENYRDILQAEAEAKSGHKSMSGIRQGGGDTIVINRMHCIVRELMAEEKDPREFFETVFEKLPDCVMICDEVGNGIVPMSRSEREYRDAVGDILISAAEKAVRVERVICGLGQRIK